MRLHTLQALLAVNVYELNGLLKQVKRVKDKAIENGEQPDQRKAPRWCNARTRLLMLKLQARSKNRFARRVKLLRRPVPG
jgi:hypothetical protein